MLEEVQLSTFYTDNEKLLVAVDSVIFGYEDGQMKLLLFKRKIEPFKDKWSLIGRFVSPKEDIREAASSVLYDYTGLKNIFLEQLFTFGKVFRDPGSRVISIVYYSLTRINDFEKKVVEKYDSKWFSLNEIPELVLDHSEMVSKARMKLIEKTQQYPIGIDLLPEKFTMPQLFNLYQSLYDRKLDDRNFRKKIEGMNILKKLNEKDKRTSKKGAFLYKFDKKKYNQLLKKGYDFRI